MSKNRSAVVLNLPVEFSGVTIGEGVARIGFRVRRECLNVVADEESLCGRRLNGLAVVMPPGDSQAQTYIPGTDAAEGRHAIEGVFDVKRFSVSPKWISAGLTFSLEEIDLKELGYFSKQSGYLVVNEVGEIPAKEKPAKVRVSANGTGDGDGGSDGDELISMKRPKRTSPKAGAKRRNGARMMSKPK